MNGAASRAHTDARAQRLCVKRIDDNEPRIVHSRIGIDEAAAEMRLETCAPAAALEPHTE